MTSQAATIEEYLAQIPEDRRSEIGKVREVILNNLPDGYEECIQYGMIGYVVPHSLYPAGYSCDPKQPLPYAALGNQKNHMSLHLMAAYGDTATREWFEKAYAESGKKLDMGKACVRFKKADDLPLDVIGQFFARIPVDKYIAGIEALQATRQKSKK